MTLKGRIVFKTLSTNPDYVLLTPNGYETVKQHSCKTDFAHGDCVECDHNDASSVSECKEPGLVKEIDAFITAKGKARDLPTLVDDEAMRAFKPALMKGAELVARKLLLMSPVLIRFNDDCDGISSGVLVKKAIESFIEQNKIPVPKGFLRNKQCNSAVYEWSEASWDCNENSFPEYQEKPLLFLLDFAGNPESLDGLKKASEIFDVVIIDHHVYSPQAKEIAKVFLNPLEFGGISSHTTGLIAFEFAKALAGEKVLAWQDYAFYSMESDKSIYRKKETFKQALVLDYLAAQGLSLEKYEKALGEDLQFHYIEATGKIEACKQRALAKAKAMEVDGVTLVLSDLEGVTAKNEFPPKGKVLNEVQKHYGGDGEGKLVTSIGFDNGTIQFRVSKSLHAKGFKATEIIDLAKKEFPGITGGGHEQAAAMRADKDSQSAVLEKTIEIVKKKLHELNG